MSRNESKAGVLHDGNVCSEIEVSVAAPVPQDRAEQPAGRLKIALSALDKTLATAFASMDLEDHAELVRLAAGTAQALGVGVDRDRSDARVRLAAREIATYRTAIATLELTLARCVANVDERRAALISRTLDGLSKRLAMWLEEHRLSCSAGRRSVSVVTRSGLEIEIASEK